MKKYIKSLEYHQKSLSIREKIHDRSGQSASITNIGSVYYALSDYKTALRYFSRALKIDNEIGNPWNQLENLSNIGNTYHFLGLYKKSLEYHKESLKISEKLGNFNREITSLCDITRVFIELGEYKKALQYLSRVETISGETIPDEILCETLILRAELSLRNNNLENTAKHAQAVISRAKKKGLKLQEAEAILLLARAKNSEYNYLLAIKLYKELQNKYEMAVAQYYYSKFLLLNGNNDRAKQQLHKSKDFFKKIDNKAYLQKIKELYERLR